jgi:peptidoglycan/LPS O-acetylase OafA/YrhL
MIPEKRGTGYIPTLDGWRAIAVIAVMLYHGTTSLFYPSGPFPSYEALRIIQTGARGVDIFFAISGFLICSRLLSEHEKTGRISLTGFYIRRAFRILPPYLVYLAVIACLAAAGVLAVEGREFVGCLLFVRNYYGPVHEHGWYTGHFWSLAVEEHFYLLWPLLLIALGSRRARSAAVLLALLVPVWQAINDQLGIVQLGSVSQRTDVRIDALLWGCWAALVLAVPEYRILVIRLLRPWVWWALVLSFAVLVRYGSFSEEHSLTRHAESFLLPWLLVGTGLHPGWWVSRVLEFRLLRWVGRLSYSLYIWQQVWMLGSWKEVRPFPLGPFQELPLSLLCTFGCAVLSYYLVEKPLVAYGTRLAAARTAPRTKKSAATPEPELAK